MPQLTLQCLKDTYIDGATPHGLNTELIFDINRRMYFYFDISAIPRVATDVSAMLFLYLKTYNGYGEFRGWHNDWPDSSWEESNLNSGNEPQKTYGISYSAKSITGMVNYTMTFVMNDYVLRTSRDGKANNGFVMRAEPQYSDTPLQLIFASKEESNETNRPILVISYSVPGPSVPTYLTPSGGIVVDRGAVQRLTWQHNPAVAGEVQSKFDIQWRKQGTTTWNTLTQTSTNQYYEYPAGTFEHGYIEWQVRTYDQENQVSPWSAISLFNAGDKPSVPVISTPTEGQVLSGPRPIITWTATGQIEYNFKILNGGVVFEKDLKTTEMTLIPEYSLENGKSYTLQLSIKNSDGLWSDISSINVTTSFVLPPVPVITPATDTIRGSIILYVYNAAPGAGQSTPVANELYRRKQGETDWQRIAKEMENNAVYTDYTAACAVTYEYKVRAIDSNYSYIDSQTVTVQTTFQNSQLALVSDYSVYVELKYGPQKSQSNTLIGQQMHFAGRKYPVTQYSQFKEKAVAMSFKVFDIDTLKLLDLLCDSQQTVLFRDSRGRRIFGTVFGLEIRDNLPDYYEVSFTINQIDYMEVV